VEGLDSNINNNTTELRQDGAVRPVLLRRLEPGYDITCTEESIEILYKLKFHTSIDPALIYLVRTTEYSITVQNIWMCMEYNICRHSIENTAVLIV
jgi:hypothetical protein